VAVLFQAIRALEVPPPLCVVGYSLGGAVALELAKFEPLGVAGLVLVEPALEAARMSFAARAAALSEGEFRAKYAEILEPYGAPEATAADRHWAETAAFASSTAVYRSAKGLFEAAGRGEPSRRFEALQMRTTVVISPQTQAEWHDLFLAQERGVRLKVIASPSRAPFFDAPAAFYEAVAEGAAGLYRTVH
jgi:pimeloyl-ACP methyl ester carboxylesterase